MIFHPWRELRQLAHIRVSHVPMSGVDELAYTNGVDRIWLDKDLLQVERRCALTHELQHIYMGHTGHQPPRVELTVRIITARRLIHFDHLMAAAYPGINFHQLADDLHVTPAVLADTAAAAGVFNIPAASPAYQPGLDRDKDGFGCDAAGTPAFNPALVVLDQPPAPAPVADPPQVTTMPQGGADTGATIKPAPDMTGIALGGGMVLAAAAGGAYVVRRRVIG